MTKNNGAAVKRGLGWMETALASEVGGFMDALWRCACILEEMGRRSKRMQQPAESLLWTTRANELAA